MQSQRHGLLFVLYGTLVVGGLLLARQSFELPLPDLLRPGDDVYVRWAILTAAAAYILVAALPFVPAAEIGLSLMLLFGPEVAGLMYLCTIIALTMAYLAGRAVPARACAVAFEFFGLRKARDLALQLPAGDAEARVAVLSAHAPARVVAGLLRHRYLALAVALNLPGNTLLGGGGGIALTAGLSGLYPLPGYLATVAIAVAPVPLLVATTALLY